MYAWTNAQTYNSVSSSNCLAIEIASVIVRMSSLLSDKASPRSTNTSCARSEYLVHHGDLSCLLLLRSYRICLVDADSVDPYSHPVATLPERRLVLDTPQSRLQPGSDVQDLSIASKRSIVYRIRSPGMRKRKVFDIRMGKVDLSQSQLQWSLAGLQALEDCHSCACRRCKGTVLV